MNLINTKTYLLIVLSREISKCYNIDRTFSKVTLERSAFPWWILFTHIPLKLAIGCILASNGILDWVC